MMTNFSKQWLIYSLVTSTLLFWCNVVHGVVDAKSKDIHYLTLSLNKKPMSDVAYMIAQKLGYTVLLSDEITAVQITGEFENVTVDQFLSRTICRDFNVVVLVDDIKQTITVSSLGQRREMLTFLPSSVQHDAGREISMTDEIVEGVESKDVVYTGFDVDPLDIEVVEGIKYKDITFSGVSQDPLDIEVVEGVRLRENTIVGSIDPQIIEVVEGVKQRDVIFAELDTEIMEVVEGVLAKEALFQGRSLTAQ